jgi:hypothetical protein
VLRFALVRCRTLMLLLLLVESDVRGEEMYMDKTSDGSFVGTYLQSVHRSIII